MNSRVILFLTCIVLITTIYGCGMMSKKYLKTESVQYEISTSGKKKIKLDNINGSISISRSNNQGSLIIKAQKEIKVKKKYLDAPFDEIEVKIDTTSSNIISVSTEINKSGEDGIFKFNLDREQKVNYQLQVPDEIEIEVENVNGNVSTDGLNNNVKIDLVNGEVDMDSFTGRLECEITNGSFSGHIDSTAGIDLNTINGNVTLFLNNYLNANVRAETVSGKISDENLQFRDVIKEKRMFKGKLGNGDYSAEIRIETVRGRIKLYGRNEI